jgi:hypothetical protein
MSLVASGICATRANFSGCVLNANDDSHQPFAASPFCPRSPPRIVILTTSLQMYPQHPQQRARVDRWMHWHHTASRCATTTLLVPFLSGESEALAAQGRAEVARHVQVASICCKVCGV